MLKKWGLKICDRKPLLSVELFERVWKGRGWEEDDARGLRTEKRVIGS